MRNLFERVLVRQAGRLANKESVTKEELMEIAPEDFETDEKPSPEDKAQSDSGPLSVVSE